jgi:hypothetical protein
MNIVQIYRDVIKFFDSHKSSISPQHKRHLNHVRRELVRRYPTKQEQEMLDPYSDLILALFLFDLEALRPHSSLYTHGNDSYGIGQFRKNRCHGLPT